MGSHLDTIAPIALAVVGSLVGNPELGLLGGSLGGLGASGGAALGAGLGSAGVNYSQNHSLGRALESGGLSAGGTYLGSNIGGSLFGGGEGSVGNLGTVGGALNSGFGTGASSDIASALGSGAGAALGTPVGSVLGGYAGNTLAQGFQPPGANTGRGIYEPQYQTPGGAGGMPTSLNSMASLTPQQQGSSLATQGVYGGGLGPQEQGYFKNLVNNEIAGGGGPNAIESSYLSNLGFGNQGSNYNLAKALNSWNPSA